MSLAVARRQGYSDGPDLTVFPTGRIFNDGMWVNRVECGDALYLMSRLPDNGIGAIISDPPLLYREADVSEIWEPEIANSRAAIDRARPYAQQFRRITRAGGAVVLMASVHAVATWMMACEEAGLIWMAELTVLWNTDKPRVRNFGSLCTHVLWFTVPGARHTWNADRRLILSNILVCDKISQQFKHHPSQKPVELTNFLVGLLSKPADVILDPFAGSGSTLVSAEMAGRKWIGFEREKPHVRMAQRRVQHWEVEDVGKLYLWNSGGLEEV